MSDTDPNGSANERFGGAAPLAGFGWNQFAQPERPARKKIKSIEASVDPQRRGKPSRATCEIEQHGAFPEALHQLDSFKRFQRADQYSSANASLFAGNIQHKVHAVVEIDVHMPMPQKKRAVAGCRAAKMMSCGIAWRVTLRLHDASTEPSLGQLAHHNFSNEKPRKLQRVAGKFFSSEAAKFEMRGFHGHG
jgi:hypothetical protein